MPAPSHNTAAARPSNDEPWTHTDAHLLCGAPLNDLALLTADHPADDRDSGLLCRLGPTPTARDSAE